MRTWLVAFSLAFLTLSGARAQDASPHAIDIPPWFVETFLDFREDVRDAAQGQPPADGLFRPGRLPLLPRS